MGGTMVDTMVLVYAFDYENKRARSRKEQYATAYRHQHTPDRLAASAELVRGLDVIWASTITIVEFMRTIKDDQREWLDSFGARIQPVEVSRAVADKAANLLRKRSEPSSDVCPKCLNHSDGSPCGKCGRSLSRHFAVTDATIAACAEVHDHIQRLCTYDSGILAFSQFVKRCSIGEPPPPAPTQMKFPGMRDSD